MFPRNAASPPRIAVGAVTLIADGVVQTSGCSVVVRPEGGAEAAGGGTIAYSAASGVVYYTPTQAETDYTAFCVIAYKADCHPAAVTVITSASTVAGRTMPADGSVTAAVIDDNAIDTATFAAGTTIPRCTLVDTTTTNTDMRGTDSAALAATALSTAVWTNALATNIATTNSNWGVGGALTLQLNTIEEHASEILIDTGTTIPAQIAALNNITAASVVTAMGTGTFLTAIPWNAAWDAEVESEVTDALTAALTEGYRATGATGSVRDLLYEINQGISEFVIVSTTKTVRKLDASTTAKTYTLNDATTPTGITETT